MLYLCSIIYRFLGSPADGLRRRLGRGNRLLTLQSLHGWFRPHGLRLERPA